MVSSRPVAPSPRPPVGLVDSHAHLEMPAFGEDLPQVLARAQAAGVEHVVTVGTTLPDVRAAVALAERFPGQVTAAGGVHPHEAKSLDNAALAELGALARGGKLHAIGETGLDFHYDHSPRPVQEEAFRRQLALAAEVDLPVIIHLREAYGRALQILGETGVPPRGGVVHCYSGSAAEARGFLELGLFLSLTGTITFPSARSRAWNAEVLAGLPLDRLLVETDCPYLTPHPHRKERNEPARVALVAEALGKVKGVSARDASRVTTRNAIALFRLPLPLPAPAVAYTIRDAVYLNVTSACPNACVFCRRGKDPVVKGHDLALTQDPSAEEMLAALEEEGWQERGEVVFCGYGEPTCRLAEVLAVARALKSRGCPRVRLNTNGLGSLVAGHDIVPRLRGAVDAVSVSLNAPTAEQYERLCRPTVGPHPFGAVLAFARSCLAAGIETTLTAVALPALDLDACREVAEGVGARFRVRTLDEVG